MGVSDEAKNVIPLKFLRKIKNKNFFPLVNSIRGRTVYKNESPFVSLAKTQKRLDRFEYLFFILFALLQGWFKKKKKSEKLPGKLENSGKTESAFFCGNGWNDLANFFFNVRNNPYEVFM
jgi:hypothetical protein